MNKWAEIVLGGIATVLFAILLAVILVEWFAGCGETWVQADGSRVIGDCVFINNK
jgi:hypothetical protein